MQRRMEIRGDAESHSIANDLLLVGFVAPDVGESIVLKIRLAQRMPLKTNTDW
jgi:hypothetical protein